MTMEESGAKRARVSAGPTASPSRKAEPDEEVEVVIVGTPPPVTAVKKGSKEKTGNNGSHGKKAQNGDLMASLEALPKLLRAPDDEAFQRRRRFPYSAHRYFETYTDPNREEPLEDPYVGVVVWAKMPGHPYWPSRVATEDERETLWPGKLPELTATQSLSEDVGKPSDNLMLYFLGSQQVGLVRRSNTEAYLPKFKEYAHKNTSKQFLTALEDADGEAMRAHFADGVGRCMACGGTDDPENIILCDRCNSEAHMRCMRPKMESVPDDEWFCPLCVVEAPLSFEHAQLLADRVRKLKTVQQSPSKMSIMNRAIRDDDAEGDAEVKEKLPWNIEDDRTLIEQLFATGGNWEQVAGMLRGRSVSSCRNRHTVLYRKGHSPTYSALSGKDPSKHISAAELEGYLSRISIRSEEQEDEERRESIAQTKPKRAPTPVAAFQPSSNEKKDEKKDEKGFVKKSKPSSGTSSITGAASGSAMKSTRTLGASSGAAPGATQIALMLDDVTRVKRRSGPSGSNLCFVCGCPGADVVCAEDKCDRVYHGFCLGSLAPSGATSEWLCPWHYCAVCRALSSSGDAPVASLPSDYSAPPPLADLAGTVRISQEQRPKEKDALRGLAETAQPNLIRCCACPLALCEQHLSVVSEVFSKPHQVILTLKRSRGEGEEESDYFGCERCAGFSTSPPVEATSTTSVTKRQSTSMFSSASYNAFAASRVFMQQLPRIPLARLQDRILSELVSKHDRLCSFIIRRPSKEVIEAAAGLDAVEPFFALSKAGRPLSLGEIQAKVRQLEYPSVRELREDIQWLTEELASIYERKHPRLAEACRSVPFCFSEVCLNKNKEIMLAESQQSEEVMKMAQVLSDARIKACLAGLMPWESIKRVEIAEVSVSGNANALLEQWSRRVFLDRERSLDGKSTLALLVQSLESAKLIPGSGSGLFPPDPEQELLTPSRAELDSLLEEHSVQLRAALKTAAEIRYQVGRLCTVVDGLPNQDDVLTIGGGRIEAEREAANRSLRAKLDETKQALELERKARVELELRLAKLSSNEVTQDK